MKNHIRTGSMDICIGYRMASIILTTMAYLMITIHTGNNSPGKWGIAAGMLTSCFLGCWLYKRLEGQKGWLKLTLAMELFAYGVFTYMSGGLSSPYLWYCMGCLLIMLAIEGCKGTTIPGYLWFLLCVSARRLVVGISYQDVNVGLGIILLMGGFYVLRCYIIRLDKQGEELRQLNIRLTEEKERSEQAFLQLANIYETFNLFAMTNQEQIVKELAVLLRRTIAPSGCVLVKLDMEGNAECHSASGMDRDAGDRLVVQVLEKGWNWTFSEDNGGDSRILNTTDGSYEVMLLGDEGFVGGMLIRLTGDRENSGEQDRFYKKLIEIVLYNLNIQGQLEQYIASEEQNRIASEIHDTVIQKLFGMVCSLKVLETRMGELEQDEIRNGIMALKQTAELTMSELRETIYGRRFDGPDGDTFMNSLKLYLEDTERISGAVIRTRIDDTVSGMSAAQKIAVYRIVCEAVNNAIRHGNADEVDVELQMHGKSIRAVIEDNGSGFRRKPSAPKCGNGLKNMHRMASLLKGRFVLEAGRDKGTRAVLNLPG